MPQTWEPLQTDTLQVQSEGPVNTGLYNADGTPIWRMPEPIGFPITDVADATLDDADATQ